MHVSVLSVHVSMHADRDWRRPSDVLLCHPLHSYSDAAILSLNG